MAYRGALEAVHARCEELATRVSELTGAPPPKRRGANLQDALALESRLRARLVVLEACKLHDIDLTPETPPVAPMIFVHAPVAVPRRRRRDALVALLITGVMVGVVLVVVARMVNTAHSTGAETTTEPLR